jgi:hypothetical protein
MNPNILTMVEAKSAMIKALDLIIDLEAASRAGSYGLSPNRTDRQLVADAFEEFYDAVESFACCLTNAPKSDMGDAERYLAREFDQNEYYDKEPPRKEDRLIGVCEAYAYGEDR